MVLTDPVSQEKANPAADLGMSKRAVFWSPLVWCQIFIEVLR